MTSNINKTSIKDYQNVEDLYNDIQNNIIDRKTAFKSISLGLRVEYINYLAKLRQKKYRASHKEIINERVKRCQAKKKLEDPEKYKQKCKESNKKYIQKLQNEFIEFIKQNTNNSNDSQVVIDPSILKKLRSKNCLPQQLRSNKNNDDNDELASGASTLTDVSPVDSNQSSQQD